MAGLVDPAKAMEEARSGPNPSLPALSSPFAHRRMGQERVAEEGPDARLHQAGAGGGEQGGPAGAGHGCHRTSIMNIPQRSSGVQLYSPLPQAPSLVVFVGDWIRADRLSVRGSGFGVWSTRWMLDGAGGGRVVDAQCVTLLSLVLPTCLLSWMGTPNPYAEELRTTVQSGVPATGGASSAAEAKK